MGNQETASGKPQAPREERRERVKSRHLTQKISRSTQEKRSRATQTLGEVAGKMMGTQMGTIQHRVS
jgi:hypothetical protein